jgi:hypothetical protein
MSTDVRGAPISCSERRLAIGRGFPAGWLHLFLCSNLTQDSHCSRAFSQLAGSPPRVPRVGAVVSNLPLNEVFIAADTQIGNVGSSKAWSVRVLYSQGIISHGERVVTYLGSCRNRPLRALHFSGSCCGRVDSLMACPFASFRPKIRQRIPLSYGSPNGAVPAICLASVHPSRCIRRLRFSATADGPCCFALRRDSSRTVPRPLPAQARS